MFTKGMTAILVNVLGFAVCQQLLPQDMPSSLVQPRNATLPSLDISLRQNKSEEEGLEIALRLVSTKSDQQKQNEQNLIAQHVTLVTSYYQISNNAKHPEAYFEQAMEQNFAAWGKANQSVIFFHGSTSHSEIARKSYLESGGSAERLKTILRPLGELKYDDFAQQVGEECHPNVNTYPGLARAIAQTFSAKEPVAKGQLQSLSRIWFNKYSFVDECFQKGYTSTPFAAWFDMGPRTLKKGAEDDASKAKYYELRSFLKQNMLSMVAASNPPLKSGHVAMITYRPLHISKSQDILQQEKDYNVNLLQPRQSNMYQHGNSSCLRLDQMYIMASAFVCDIAGSKRLVSEFEAVLQEYTSKGIATEGKCTCFTDETLLDILYMRSLAKHARSEEEQWLQDYRSLTPEATNSANEKTWRQMLLKGWESVNSKLEWVVNSSKASMSTQPSSA